MNEQELIQAALSAREHAHAPFSGFKVGAALLDQSGKIHTGCNVENSTFGLTLCAERVAIFKALSEGKRQFKTIVVAADSQELTPPCGACRQIIWEFCGNIDIILVNPRREKKEYKVKDLLPYPFDAKFFRP